MPSPSYCFNTFGLSRLFIYLTPFIPPLLQRRGGSFFRRGAAPLLNSPFNTFFFKGLRLSLTLLSIYFFQGGEAGFAGLCSSETLL